MTEEAQNLINEVQSTQQQNIQQTTPEQTGDVQQNVSGGVQNPTDWARSYFGADPEEVKSFYTRRNEVESRLQEAEARLKISPYASPLSERIDKMIREGKDIDSINRFVKNQTFNPESLDTETLVREYIKEQNPNFSKDDIEAYIEMEFGYDEDDDRSIKQRNLKLKSEALKAKKFFEEQKINLDSWTKEQQAKMSEQQQAQKRTQEAWGDVVDKLVVPSLTKMPISIESNDFKYNLEFPVDENVVAQVRNLISQQNLSNVPLNQDGLKQVQDLARNLTFIQNRDAILESIARDAYAKGRKAAMDETSGRSPISPARGRPPVVKPGQVPRGFI